MSIKIFIQALLYLKYSISHAINYFLDIKFVTPQKMKFSIKDFFSKCDQICSFLRIWSHLLKKSLMENLLFFEQFVYQKISGFGDNLHFV